MSASSASAASPPLLRFPSAWLFSSIGKKTVVAVTGIVLVAFVIGHLLGNLSIFLGPEAINSYGMHLRDLGPLLWVFRIGLLAAVGLHIWFTMLLWKENLAARPQKYAVFAPMRTTIFARTMRLSGLFILAFVAFHLAHFTLHIVDPGYAQFHTSVDGREAHDVYRMVVLGFRNPFVSLFYVVALALVAFHLSHGMASLFQTLGLATDPLRTFFGTASTILAWLFFLGYSSIPVAILVFGLGAEIQK